MSKVELDELLAASDVITIHAPLFGSKHMLTKTFARMKKGVYLVNAGRGHNDEDALYDA